MSSTSSAWVGVVLACAGNLVISLALNVQKLAHMRVEEASTVQEADDEDDEDGQRTNGRVDQAGEAHEETPLKEEGGKTGTRSYLKTKLWWTGLFLMVLGEVGNFIAYGYASASTIAPLGTVALVANAVFSPLFLGERFDRYDLFGVVLCIAGAIVIVLSTGSESPRLGPDDLVTAVTQTPFLIFVVLSVMAGSTLATLSYRMGERSVMIDVGMSGLLGAYTVMSTRGVSSILSRHFSDLYLTGVSYALLAVLIISAIGQIKYTNLALSRFDSREVIPVQFVLFTIAAIVGSSILYRDFENVQAPQALNFVFGCATTFFGVYLLTKEQSRQEDEETGSVGAGQGGGGGSAQAETRSEPAVESRNPSAIQTRPSLDGRASFRRREFPTLVPGGFLFISNKPRSSSSSRVPILVLPTGESGLSPPHGASRLQYGTSPSSSSGRAKVEPEPEAKDQERAGEVARAASSTLSAGSPSKQSTVAGPMTVNHQGQEYQAVPALIPSSQAESLQVAAETQRQSSSVNSI